MIGEARKVIWKHVKAYKYRIYKGIATSILVAIIIVVAPYLIGRLIDNVSYMSKTILLLGIVALYAMDSIKDYWDRHINASKEEIGVSCMIDLMCDFYSHLARLPASFYQKKDTGSLDEKIYSAANYLYYFVSEIVFLVLPQMMMAIAALIILFYINYLFFTVIFLTLMIHLILTVSITNSQVESQKEIRRRFNNFGSCSQSIIKNIFPVKSLGIENIVSREFLKHGKGIKRSTSNLHGKVASKEFLQKNVLTIGKCIIVLFLLFYLKDGKISFGNVVIVISYMTLLTSSFSSLLKQYGWVKRAIVSIENVNAIFDEFEEEYDAGAAICTQNGIGAIRFAGLSYSPKIDSETLKNISLEIHEGTGLYAFIGESGSGKSTITKALTKHFKYQGNIFFGGKNISDIKTSSLRECIYLVEGLILFNKSIRFNIAVGNFNASEDEIKNALRAVGLESLINDMDRIVGLPSSVDSASDGEKQRILIARSLVRALKEDVQVLIYDEPTRALDPKSAKLVMNTLKELSDRKKVIVITHDLLNIADEKTKKIFVMESGMKVEEGTHGELIKINGKYAVHFKQQKEAIKVFKGHSLA